MFSLILLFSTIYDQWIHLINCLNVLVTVEILQTIARRLNHSEWTINRTSCGTPQWNDSIVEDDIISNVTCNCTFNNRAVCHVTQLYVLSTLYPIFSMNHHDKQWSFIWIFEKEFSLYIIFLFFNSWLKGYNLTGVLPDEFGNLTYLQDM